MLRRFYSNYKPRVVCEVGVQKGFFSKLILRNMPSVEKLYLIDLWEQQPNYNDYANVSNNIQESYYQETLHNIHPWKDKVSVLRGYSSIMCHEIPDDSLDWVYIDARHDYLGCKEDIECYYPKVKRGGIVSGHDYMTAADVKRVSPDQDWSICSDGTIEPRSVKGAVDDFVSSINKEVTTTMESIFPSWYFIK